MKTIEYGLPVTILSNKELYHIFKPTLAVGLSKSGICRKMSRQVVFGPIKYQGLGLHNPFDTQGIRKLELLFNNSQPLTLQLIDASWARMMAESGYGADFWKKTTT
jgi:hypothetical protein